MESFRIADLLHPFLGLSPGGGALLPQPTLSTISIYLDMLLRWNARMNLTSIRDPEEIITRHFGESLFAAQHLLSCTDELDVIDVGSGAGFPGLPIKIWAPDIHMTLIESNQKKATFLRELIRTLRLSKTEVFAGRAEVFTGEADVVTLRAVDNFEDAVFAAIKLVKSGGKIALLISKDQFARSKSVPSPPLTWLEPELMPLSESRILSVGIVNRVNTESN
jgi:16S rRNA (guanine527-N7)-methyltransferase